MYNWKKARAEEDLMGYEFKNQPSGNRATR
jgi:hypothetical protein